MPKGRRKGTRLSFEMIAAEARLLGLSKKPWHDDRTPEQIEAEVGEQQRAFEKTASPWQNIRGVMIRENSQDPDYDDLGDWNTHDNQENIQETPTVRGEKVC